MPRNSGVLVTGASGFIGGRIVEVMHFAGRDHVRAGIRSINHCARIGRFPVETVRLDLLDPANTARALEGVDSIVHCAMGTLETAVDGTANLLQAALDAKISRVIHLSSTVVYGNAEGIVNEDHPLVSTGNAYADAKSEAEKVCERFRQRGLPVTMLRLPIVYGPFSAQWSVHVARMLMNREWGIFEEHGKGTCNLLHVDDSVRAIIRCLTSRESTGRTFNVRGNELISWNEYFERYNKALGLAPIRRIGGGSAGFRTTIMGPVRTLGAYVRDHHMDLVKSAARASSTVDKLLRKTERRLKATPVREELAMFGRSVDFSIDRIKSEIGFRPEISVDQGLTQTTLWLRQQGFLEGVVASSAA